MLNSPWAKCALPQHGHGPCKMLIYPSQNSILKFADDFSFLLVATYQMKEINNSK